MAARSPQGREFRRELQALAAALPLRVIALPKFRRASYQPGQIRQPRTYVPPDESMQAIGRFLIERGTVELLTPDKTLALFEEMHWCGWRIHVLARREGGDAASSRADLVEARRLVSRMEAAEEELFIANRRMIVNCVKPYFWIGQVWLGDFLQEGSKALANAIRKFDFRRGTPFFSYSQTAVQNRLRNFFRDHVRSGSFGIRPSREMVLIKNILDTWRRDYGEEPTDAVVAKIADLPEDRVAKVRNYVTQWERMPPAPISLDALVNEDGTDLHELIEDPDAPVAQDAAEQSEIWQAVEQLPERSRYILKLRFLEGRTLEETGQLLNLTRARIKQIQDAALKRVRQLLGNPTLPPDREA